MNDFQRGMQMGIQMCISLEKDLAKSPAFFVKYEEWLGYKRGVLDYRDKIIELRDLELSDYDL